VAPRPLEELFGIILELATEAIGAERGVLMTLEPDGLRERARRGRSFRISQRVRDRVLDEKVSLIVPDTRLEEEWQLHQSIVSQGIRSLMAVPLQTDDRVIGLLYLDSPGAVRQFTAQDLELITVMGNVAAIRIERERLAEVEKSNQLLENELRQAAEIQRLCLPDSPPLVEGLDVAAHSVPCRTVGGDYYGYFDAPDGKLCLVVGDVAGKGMPASLLMMNLQARVQVLAQEVSDPGVMAEKLNRSLLGICPSNRFITLCICILDPTSGEFRYCNAGHERGLVLGADGSRAELDVGGPIIGLLKDVDFESGKGRLEPGGALVLFSDGVTEAMNPEGEQLGQERLAALLEQCDGSSAAEMVGQVEECVGGWLCGAPAQDDVTVVAVIKA
jgi:serine phosphatase RsbU (regulator of sigma subunit)